MRRAQRKRSQGRQSVDGGVAAVAAVKADGLDLPKLQRNTLNEAVYQQLKQALMSGRIAPGSTMTIRSLASCFGVSLMPVREALRRLVAEHVLVLQPNRSVALPVITRERFREITRIRTSLEGLAVEEAAAHPQNAQREVYREVDGLFQPSPAPRFGRTPGAISCAPSEPGARGRDALSAWGLNDGEIDALEASGAITAPRSIPA